MNIEFDCPGCGKHYSVKASAAGKRGPCKACGKPMTVPDAPDDSLYEIADDAAPEVEPLAPLGRKRAPAVRQSATQPAAKPKKRKSDSLYETLWGSESIWGGPRCTTLNKVVRGVAGIGSGCALALIVGLLARAGFMSQEEYAAELRAQIAMMDEITSLFRPVHDAAGARPAADKAAVLIERFNVRNKANAIKRVNRDEIDEVTEKYKDALRNASNAMWAEINRVRAIPDANEEVIAGLKPAFDELTKSGSSPGLGGGSPQYRTPLDSPVPVQTAPTP